MNMEEIKKVMKPIDPLNIYFNLFDLFRIQKVKLITGDNFIVSDGILKCQNYFIPLDSISLVEMARIQLSPWFSIGIFFFGLFVSVFNVFVYREHNTQIPYTGFLIGFGFVLSASVIFLNTKLPYTMTIRLNNNLYCTYMNRNKRFIQDIMDKMQECINNRKGEYTFMLNQGKIEYNDNHSINIGGGVGGDFIASGANKEIHENSHNIINRPQNKTGITAEDWVNLEKYFIMKQQDFPIGDRNYKICNNLITYTQKKDAGKIKSYLQTIGKEALRMLFVAGTNVAAMETVKPIVNKILSLKG